MSNLITLYAYDSRSRAERVLWLLQELDLDHQVIRLSFNQREDLAKVNPLLKVPCIIHSDFTLTESMAICRYLCGLKSNSFIPKEVKSAARMDERILIGINEIESHLWLMDQAIHIKRFDASDEFMNFAMAKVRGGMKLVTEWLSENDFIAGNEFTIADILYYHLITWAHGMYGIEMNEEVELFLSRMEARKAFPTLMKHAGSPASNI